MTENETIEGFLSLEIAELYQKLIMEEWKVRGAAKLVVKMDDDYLHPDDLEIKIKLEEMLKPGLNQMELQKWKK